MQIFSIFQLFCFVVMDLQVFVAVYYFVVTKETCYFVTKSNGVTTTDGEIVISY